MNDIIGIWAHRGASGYAPENTLASFQMAIDMGADGVELDIQLTKDGEIVVIHDETVDRTTDGTGWVKDLTLAEIKKLNANYQNGMNMGSINGKAKKVNGSVVYPEYEFVEIPTMQEVFELIKPTELIINIEIKTGIVFYPDIEKKIIDMVKEYGMEKRVCYSSFNHYTVMKVKELDPSAEVGFLYADGPIDMPAYGIKHGVNALHPALYNLQYPGFVEECKKAGLKLHVWTVNEDKYMEQCAKYGIDAVITNYPDLARTIIG